MRHLIVAFVLIAGCGSDGLPSASCQKLSEADCSNGPGCSPFYCSGCDGTSYAGCFADTDQAHRQCPAIGCTSCTGRGEQGCLDRGTSCRADYCPNCQGGHDFISCANPSDPQIGCGLDCPAPCNLLADAASCNARTDCHAVFQPAGACGCAGAGCCIHFDHCADGQAQCNGQPACTIPSPICDGPYAVSYTNTCYEGCVLATECM
jgi:hypothetical protein